MLLEVCKARSTEGVNSEMGSASQLSFQTRHSWEQHSRLDYRYLPGEACKDRLKHHPSQHVISYKVNVIDLLSLETYAITSQ